MNEKTLAPPYRSAFLSDNWAHQKYFGWTTKHISPNIKMLTKKYLLFTRHLLLLTVGEDKALDDKGMHGLSQFGLSDIIIHDFNGILTDLPIVGGCAFSPAEKTERLLNIATFVIDLGQDEDAIFAAMSSDYRRKIRKAEAADMTVEAYPHPEKKLRVGFLNAFHALAEQHALKTAFLTTIDAMYENGDAILFVTRKGHEILSYLHLYKTEDTGFFMYGVSLSKKNDGAGQYLHWKIMQYLKTEGLSWYDLGGVASLDSSDGIFNFKRKFGGQLIELGGEWRYTGQILAATLYGKALLARLCSKNAQA